MFKFLIPAILILLVVIFWEKICEYIYGKFSIRLNYLVISAFLLVIAIIILLIKN